VRDWGCGVPRLRYLSLKQTLRDHDGEDLFHPWEYLGPKQRRLLTKSWAGVFRDFLLRHLPVEELSSSFADGVGRPSKDLFMAWRALILQQLHNQTDREIIESVSLNIAWQSPGSIR
jgi:hypothetical protein